MSATDQLVQMNDKPNSDKKQNNDNSIDNFG